MGGEIFWAAPLRPLLLLALRCGGSWEAKCKPQLVSDLVSSEEGWSENKVTVSKALKELWGFFLLTFVFIALRRLFLSFLSVMRDKLERK